MRLSRSNDVPLEFGDAPPAYRYGLFPMFLIAALFIALAPTFWIETEIRGGSIGEAYENSDLYQFIYPVYTHVYGRLRSGELPLWNPRQLCGIPLLADARVGVFQPLNAVFWLLPAERALALHAFVCLSMMGLFFALYLRALGVGYMPAVIGGMAYAFSGLSAAAMSRPALASALTWTPFLLWAVREYAHRFDRASAVLAGVAGALLILSGAYALVATALALALAFVIAAVVSPGDPGAPSLKRRAAGLALIAGVALGGSAIQWAPTLAWAWRLERPTELLLALNLATDTRAQGAELLTQLLLTAPGPLPRAGYMGIATLLMLPAALFHRARRRDVVLLAAALIALTAFIYLLSSRESTTWPVLSLFLPAQLCAAALAGIGADRLFLPRRRFRSPNNWLVGLATLTVAAALFLAFGADVRRYLIPLAVIIAVFLLFRFRGVAPLCTFAVALLLFTDLANANKNIYRHPRQDAPDCYRRYESAFGAAREQALGSRVVVSARDLDPALPGNAGMIYPLHVIGAVDLPLTDMQAKWWRGMAGEPATNPPGAGIGITPQSPRPHLLRYMAARILIAGPQSPMFSGTWTNDGPRLRELQSSGDLRTFEIEGALPRAYWVPTAQVEVGVDAAVSALSDPEFDGSRRCVVDALSPGIGRLDGAILREASAALPSLGDAVCSLEDATPERVVIRVNAPREGIVVLCDTYLSGWRATVDGRPAPMLIANGMFRGVAVPEGSHVIEHRYRPYSYYAGAALSLLTLSAMLLAGLSSLARAAASFL